jgi:hypothetical protein
LSFAFFAVALHDAQSVAQSAASSSSDEDGGGGGGGGPPPKLPRST